MAAQRRLCQYGIGAVHYRRADISIYEFSVCCTNSKDEDNWVLFMTPVLAVLVIWACKPFDWCPIHCSHTVQQLGYVSESRHRPSYVVYMRLKLDCVGVCRYYCRRNLLEDDWYGALTNAQF